MLNLFTLIPNDEGLRALRHFFDRRTVKEPSTDTLIRLAELVLTLNCFSFDDKFYKQINGVAMGTKMGPNYANLFVGLSRNEFSTNSMAQYQNFSADTSMTVSAPLHVADPSSTDSSNLSILFILLSSLPGKFPLLALLFSTSTFLSKTMVLPAFTTNPPIRTAICFIPHPIRLT